MEHAPSYCDVEYMHAVISMYCCIQNYINHIVLNFVNLIRESSLASSISVYGKVCSNRDPLFMYCFIYRTFLYCTTLRQPL